MQKITEQLPVASRGETNKIRTLESFTELCESELKVKHENMIVEYKERKAALILVKDTKVSEYAFINQIVQANTQLNNGNPSPDLIMKIESEISALTFEDSMKSMSIAYWQKEFGNAFVLPIVCDLLNYFLRQFTVKEMLDGNQIMQLSLKLISSNPDLRIKELTMCLNNALLGKYGPTYQRIGIETILEWLSKFYNQSSIELESKVLNSKEEGRGEQPWLAEDRKIKKYEDEQRQKKAVVDKVWGIEKRKSEVQDFKNMQFGTAVKLKNK